jgi:hypothetical protein
MTRVCGLPHHGHGAQHPEAPVRVHCPDIALQAELARTRKTVWRVDLGPGGQDPWPPRSPFGNRLCPRASSLSTAVPARSTFAPPTVTVLRVVSMTRPATLTDSRGASCAMRRASMVPSGRQYPLTVTKPPVSIVAAGPRPAPGAGSEWVAASACTGIPMTSSSPVPGSDAVTARAGADAPDHKHRGQDPLGPGCCPVNYHCFHAPKPIHTSLS